MKKFTKNLLFITVIFSTILNYAQEAKGNNSLIENEDYNLYKPINTQGVLLLFGGFPENAEGIENEFQITNLAIEKNVAVAYLNFNRKLWLEEDEKEQLALSLQELFTSNNLPSDNIYIGGLSSGGNMALLISNYLSQKSEYNLNPAGVFIVDSPVDLAALYRIAESNIKRKFSEASVGESTFIFNYFHDQLGNPNDTIALYEKYAAFTYETKDFQNLKDLKKTKIRFYTEPDKVWWKENMGVDYEQMNAFHIKRLSDFLSSQDFENVQFIATENKGFRADGTKNPHSWSIIDKEDLLKWMLKD
ncbi:hypothetical protein SAMN04487764_2799 [Gillisia sp. Hel1_33_143]|uniref:hypothetical protein n=1 Tax=Gillisia sp. Hel1_33_143 TaxID=1336796 RepID=UPI00087B17C3|nr:hypothetical protein [Gillisia sp. Hel1_33_143]SDS68606.1 hypothetical protein SAMN04487764_2799 [Gillisia sp. Hel1_33_143]